MILDRPRRYSDLLYLSSIRSGRSAVGEDEAISAGYRSEGRVRTAEFAKKAKIEPFIAHRLMDLGLAREHWESVHDRYVERNRRIFSLADRIFTEFEMAGLRDVFLYENFGALLAGGGCIGCFASGDIDLYARRADEGSISAVLAAEGFIPDKDKRIEGVRAVYQNSEFGENGFAMNIMWKPLSRAKLPFQMDLDRCLSEEGLQIIPGSSVRCPADSLLLYLCLLHISVHSYARTPSLRLYIDIRNMARKPVDWGRIAAWADHDGTAVRVSAAMTLANVLLRSALPVERISRNRRRVVGHAEHIVRSVLDERRGMLIENMGRWKVLSTELCSTDKNPLVAFFRILLPQREWIREHYAPKGTALFKGYVRHWREAVLRS
jgi:hypothetical protein